MLREPIAHIMCFKDFAVSRYWIGTGENFTARQISSLMGSIILFPVMDCNCRRFFAGWQMGQQCIGHFV